jgi:CRP-like cAMP-binding protein
LCDAPCPVPTATRKHTMAKLRRIHVPGENRLLVALPRAEHDRLLPHLEKVSLPLRDILYEANGPIAHVFFPLNCVISLVIMDGGFTLEVGIIGNEGMVGTPFFLGAERSPTMAIAQIPGEALRIEANVFQKEMRRDGMLHGLVQRYTQSMINQISQSIVCNHRHSVMKRMCRWLLMSHNRVGADDFLLTHEFLAQMLGVRRPTVTAVAGTLQKAGLITYHRGRITVLDRKGLEAASCECYEVIAKELDRLLG